jgi:hypothetical protein
MVKKFEGAGSAYDNGELSPSVRKEVSVKCRTGRKFQKHCGKLSIADWSLTQQRMGKYVVMVQPNSGVYFSLLSDEFVLFLKEDISYQRMQPGFNKILRDRPQIQ